MLTNNSVTMAKMCFNMKAQRPMLQIGTRAMSTVAEGMDPTSDVRPKQLGLKIRSSSEFN